MEDPPCAGPRPCPDQCLGRQAGLPTWTHMDTPCAPTWTHRAQALALVQINVWEANQASPPSLLIIAVPNTPSINALTRLTRSAHPSWHETFPDFPRLSARPQLQQYVATTDVPVSSSPTLPFHVQRPAQTLRSQTTTCACRCTHARDH